MESHDKILVTGGSGFLGSHLVHRLLHAGASVRVFDVTRRETLPPDLDFHEGDIRDRSAVRKAVQGCHTVYHLAANPQLWALSRGVFDQVNYRGSVHLFDEAMTAGCQRIVHVSSATVWPDAVRIEDGKDDRKPADFPGPYSQSKLRAEQEALRRAWDGAPIVIVSPTLPIGPWDYSLTPPTQMLLHFCQAPMGEYLETTLNLVDVRDVVEAMIHAAQIGLFGRPYLLGNESVALPDLMEMLGKPRPHRRVPYGLALGVAYASEWWSAVVSKCPPLATVAGVRLTRRPVPALSDLAALHVSPRALVQTLADVQEWFREEGWI